MRLDAFHLPALRLPPTTSWSYPGGTPGSLDLRVPHLTAKRLDLQIDGLLAAREEHLAERPVAAIVEAVDQVARRLLDRGSSLRAEARAGLTAVTGASPQMVERVLEGMAADWVGERLNGLLESEFGDPRVLDTFARPAGRHALARAYGPALTVHIFSGNVPGVGVTSLIRSLLVKSATLGKTAAGEPVLAPLFARALAEVDPGLGACLAVTYWPGGDETLDRCALERADAVIAYGGTDAIASLRQRVPGGVSFLGYGHRVSFGIIARESLTGAGAVRLADEAALAVATFDQQGCVSPHLFYVEEGGEVTARDWARQLASALERTEERLPRGMISPGEAAAIRQLRGEVEFAQIAGRGHELLASSGGTSWTAVYDPEPGFLPSCLNRVVRIKPTASIDLVPGLVRPIGKLLQTVGVAGPDDRIRPLAERLGRLGASRITPVSRMAWPPAAWHHDGRPPMADLVRWVDWESG